MILSLILAAGTAGLSAMCYSEARGAVAGRAGVGGGVPPRIGAGPGGVPISPLLPSFQFACEFPVTGGGFLYTMLVFGEAR